MKFRTASIGTIALACALVDARADTTAENLSSEVIVTATRSARSLTEVPASASFLTETDIQDTPAQSLDDVLRHVPGVNLPVQTGTQAHPTADNVSMRGLGGIHALVLVDGVPLNDPFFGYVQWGRIPLESIDHVEVVRGGGSPLWGNFAMGGVINVITRTSNRDTVVVDAGGGSHGTYRSDLYGSYGLSTNNRLTLEADFNGTDGFEAVPDYARRPFDRPTSFVARNLQLHDCLTPREDLTVNLRFSYHDNDQRLGTVVSTNRQETYSYVADAKRTFGSGASLTATAFHSDSTFVTDNSTVTDSALPVTEQSEHIDNIHTTPFLNTGGSLIWTKDFRGPLRNLTLGTDVNDIHGSDRGAIFDPTGTQQIRTDIGRGEELFVGGFVQASITPVEKLEILASGRIQYFEVLDGYDGNPGGAGNEPNQGTTRFNPRVSLRYALTDSMALRGGYYQAFRAPTLDNLYRGFASDGGIYYPNSELKPETLNGGEVGIDYVAGGVRSQVTFYRTQINNLITTATLADDQLPAGFFYGGRLINAATARAQGVEAELDWRIADGWTTTLGYTFADSVYTSNPTDPLSVGQQLQDVPRNTASAALTYTSQDRWRISTDARWLSKTQWANAEHTNPGFPYQASADSHLVVDLAGTYQVTAKIQFYLQVQNLLDRSYIVNPGPYNPPQLGTPLEVFAGVRLKLN